MRRRLGILQRNKALTGLREVRVLECRPAVKQTESSHQRRGQAIGNVVDKILQRSVDGPPEPARGQLGVRRRFVDWNNASNFERLNFRSLFRREIAVDIEHLELRLP